MLKFDDHKSDGSNGGSNDSLTCNDPFYDRFPWFRLVGRYAASVWNSYYEW